MQKKILLLILLVVVPVAVFSEDKVFSFYEAIVDSVKDVTATCGDKEVTIPKSTKITVENEEFDEQEKVMFIYNNMMCKLNSTDVLADSTKVDLKKFKNNEKSVKTVKGLKLYNGPGYGYGTTEIIIPSGFDIISSYYDDKYMYTEYNGVKGWIEYTSNVMYEDTDKIKIVKDARLLDPYSKEDLGIEIPANSIFTSKYFKRDGINDITYYFEHDGELGFVDKSSVAYETFGEITCDKTVNIYETGDPEKVIEVAAVGDTLKLLYETCTKEYYFVSYNGVNGWVLANELGESKRSNEIEAVIDAPKDNTFNNALIITGSGIAIAALTATLLIYINNKKSGKKKRSIIRDL